MNQITSRGPAMRAHFDLAAPPVRGPITVTFFGPRVQVSQVVQPRARSITASLPLKAHQVFRPGPWRIVLSVRSTVLKTLQVRVLPA